MGSFVFKWEHPASEVYVTGTFDDWSKTEKLVKTGDVFEKNVTLPSAAEKIYYKFVVDGNWVTDHTAPQENDASGNLNNVLTTDRIIKHTPETAGIMSGVAPTSTTSHLAKDVPLEKAPLEQNGSSDLPGAFPETPAATERAEFSVNPLPAADGAVNPIQLAPGEKVPAPSDFTTNTLTSGVHDDPELVAADKEKSESQTFGVSPLPAFAGAVNPVKIAPGEKIPEPSSLTANTITSAVRTDKESYENSGALGHAPVLPPVVTPQAERDQNGTGVLDLPPISSALIPESSLPVGATGAGTFDASPTIQSSGPQSTTANLAANVPLESTKVPEIVKESQAEAGFAPEASAVPEEVKEKSAVEKELLKEVPTAPSTAEGTGGQGTDKTEKGVVGDVAAVVGGAALAAGATAAAYASGAASKLPESVTSKLPESVQNSIASINASSSSGPAATAIDTPEVVKESIAESGQAPEAAGNETAVLDKAAVEKELLSEVKPATATGESAPTSSSLKAAVVAGKQPESRDISPGTVPGSHTETQTAPTVTTGVASATTEKKSTPATPAKSSTKAPESPASSTATDKKKKRTSIFGKIKAKLHSKD
ncbi:Signal transduction protein MDG1 [Lachnellula hyalina]|uniref:Signal transduction protein MDG1 n=1 Tax=Lachnellula hyalina TaxID=1316788 RepID=A0A8H8R8X8_9HELO|nr:Signal transduction protein MDG1 [Lachnellula hyalina]TVY30605.1 Signal transduction protein MDG1 [Lachnellula hyalina]